MVNVVLFFATCMYTVVDTMYSVCKHKGPIQWDTENQYTGTKFTYKGPTVWGYGDTVHVQKNNPVRTRGTKDQPYGDRMHK